MGLKPASLPLQSTGGVCMRAGTQFRQVQGFLLLFALSLACTLPRPVQGQEPQNEAMPAASLVGYTEEQFIAANTLWTLLHEVAHALIAELDIPVFSNEERVADQIATIAVLHGSADMGVPDRMPPKDEVIMVAHAWRMEWLLEQSNGTPVPYWDNHPLDIQRFYDIMCLLYGSDPDQYEAVEEELGLPFQRAFACADYEHEQARRATRRVIDVYGSLYKGIERPGKVHVVYEPPLHAAHKRLAALVEKEGIAETVATHLERLVVLPHDISFSFTGCFGKETAYWQENRREIVMCYELLDRFSFLYRANRCLRDEALNETGRDCLARQRYTH